MLLPTPLPVDFTGSDFAVAGTQSAGEHRPHCGGHAEQQSAAPNTWASVDVSGSSSDATAHIWSTVDFSAPEDRQSDKEAPVGGKKGKGQRDEGDPLAVSTTWKANASSHESSTLTLLYIPGADVGSGWWR